MKPIILSLVMMLLVSTAQAQSHLYRPVSIEASKRPVSEVLKTLSQKGEFQFSYNTNLFKADSLVSISAKNKTVIQVLDMLFGGRLDYKERDEYIILKKADNSKYWYVSGYVKNENTGENIGYVSVYEPQQLMTTLTNEAGYFKLKLREDHPVASIRISKKWCCDTSIIVSPGRDQEVVVNVVPQGVYLDTVVITQNTKFENSWLSKLLLSSKLKIQTANLSKFLVDKPYQVSIVPGVGTHGKMSGQVENKFSFNLFGGYAAGVNGFEIGGIFNIIKQDVNYVQIGGVFNVAGGKVNGVQIAGVFNGNMDSVEAVQVAGVSNVTSGAVNGLQISGVYNHTSESMKGIQVGGVMNYAQDEMRGLQIAGVMSYAGDSIKGTQVSGVMNYAGKHAEGIQIAGVANYAGDSMNGMQVAGVINVNRRGTDGMQVAGVVNYTRKLTGAQFGVINIADSSSGYSIGILNLVRNGYHKLSISSNEVVPVNLGIKTGNNKLYSMLFAGFSPDEKNKVYTFGYGMGSDMRIKGRFSFNPELSVQHLYLGDWEATNLLARGSLHLNVKLGRYLTVYGGPVICAYYTEQVKQNEGYKHSVTGYEPYDMRDDWKGWIGWNFGVNIF